MLVTRSNSIQPVEKNKIPNPSYQPQLGFIGKVPLRVSNYLYRTSVSQSRGYSHCQDLSDLLLRRSPSDHYQASQRLTKFLKKRDLTFQKTDSSGQYQIFTVPVTSTLVPMPKSVFNMVENAAQVLMISLRKVLQSIYGAPSVAESEFVQKLPVELRQSFIDATENSPHYISQIHHPVMKTYPFFDNVGLDLVLVKDYLERSPQYLEWIRTGQFDRIPELPFQILELNAGSPSGASNNSNILEGLLGEDPEILDALGKVMPNDHYQVLRETYRSLGESWTGRTDGVQVILPPGGANGASPEIHQLAAYSGLIYCDPGQLYCDSVGWLRMRTVDGADPVVTAIYSRVNTDSTLFDKDRGVLLRDPDSGEALYRVDSLKPWRRGKPEYLKDASGKPIPLQSEYTIPHALDAIHQRRLYLGGLNRLLDNKIILAILTEFGPKIFKNEIAKMGLRTDGPMICPPECLPSNAASVSRIETSMDQWVVKAASLSGGNGVHILMTQDERKRREVIREAKSRPEHFAYQRLVKIGRIPVAMRSKTGTKLANLAADIRMWVFFGAEGTLPRLTHNALVRYAPKEKGSLSSIVNTSKGGGYAPFAVIDDLGLDTSISPRDLAKALEPTPLDRGLPSFVGAQLVQIGNILSELRQEISRADSSLARISSLLGAMKIQLREVVSFLHPRCMETLYGMMDLVEKRLNEKSIAQYFHKMHGMQARLVKQLQQLNSVLPPDFFLVLDELNVVNQDLVNRGYTADHQRKDQFTFGHLAFILKKTALKAPRKQGELKRLKNSLQAIIRQVTPVQKGNLLLREHLSMLTDRFSDQAANRMATSESLKDFANLFSRTDLTGNLKYRETFVIPQEGKIPRSGTEWELVHQESLAESTFIDPEVKKARAAWLEVLSKSKKLGRRAREVFLRDQRTKHLDQFSFLGDIQKMIHRQQNSDHGAIVQLMRVMPYAAYNLRQYAIEQGVSFEKLFSNQLKPESISILDRETREREKLNLGAYAGECFAKKRTQHGLISEGDRFLWVAKEQSPLVQLYTIGHELIHAAQIKEVLEMEKASRASGPLEFAKFLNFYGNFLSLAANTLDHHHSDQVQLRTPIYGLADRIVSQFYSPVIRDIRQGLSRSNDWYHRQLKKYGSFFGYMMPVCNAVRVKALREVVPALENAKNIVFAKECGLDIDLDEVQSALPIANRPQLDRYRDLLGRAVKSWNLDWEALRIIVSHQYYGVMFPRAESGDENLNLVSDPTPIFMNTAYNQTQQ